MRQTVYGHVGVLCPAVEAPRVSSCRCIAGTSTGGSRYHTASYRNGRSDKACHTPAKPPATGPSMCAKALTAP
ncbi:hypothetical protein BO86DRAFT_30493 [Aspergillus japonicus CBS 114.51]|uniref:Uncharacterized protein n=1 Tax=Aspergillus japonicus CBS 114.51 TaxID=1448312 RepID=A0A8T8WKP5_ASPJA|nr:hypothetical protein BO86DRAFT_30493 [Aspergillus japonicus CBS 114.51]RAH76060.1 hypothetical protein BO86DRAFT_30493 [Aspergillus japonicus CBS 114.51]